MTSDYGTGNLNPAMVAALVARSIVEGIVLGFIGRFQS
jgi:hypothetical protein